MTEIEKMVEWLEKEDMEALNGAIEHGSVEVYARMVRPIIKRFIAKARSLALERPTTRPRGVCECADCRALRRQGKPDIEAMFTPPPQSSLVEEIERAATVQRFVSRETLFEILAKFKGAK